MPGKSKTGLIIDKDTIISKLMKKRGVYTESKKDTGKEKAPKDFKLWNAIREEKDYKSNIHRRDINSRKKLEKNKPSGRKSIMPGQLIMFNYYQPKTEEELEYWDAQPVTIFFNVIQAREGERVLGFNLHYYPPRVRWQIMDRIFEIFRPYYESAWNKEINEDLAGFNYQLLIGQLEAQGLAFGVRMYDPQLMSSIRAIPPKEWSKAALTEGMFRKRTREMIMNYWKNEFGKKNKRAQQKAQRK